MTDTAVDEILERYDELFLQGRFEEADAMLQAEDVSALDTAQVTAILSVTKAAADKLPSRAVFVGRAVERFRTLAPDRTDRLMTGLR